MISIKGSSLSKIDRSSAQYKALQAFHERLKQKDSTIWGPDAQAEASIRLNWIDLPESSRELLPQFDALAAKHRDKSSVILCGMGGSSLGPEVIAQTFSKKLFVLDSTDPDYVAHALTADLAKSVVVVSSKSGSTIETASQKKFFEKLFTDAGLNPVDHFVIVTDPGSPLDLSARSSGLRVINADPRVGGRFSALSAFGLVPAALLGVDVSVLIDDADMASKTFAKDNSVAVKIATLIFEQTNQNFSLQDGTSNVPGLGDWIEQLVAESTGKDQKGRLPIVVETKNSKIAGKSISIAFADGEGDLNIVASLGEHFILWEWVTALLCRALAVDPFNQPNVTEAKERTSTLLNERSSTAGAKDQAIFESPNLKVFGSGKYLEIGDVLKDLIARAGGYLAIMAYLNRESDFKIIKLREAIASKSNIGITFGWGPRFLHSTGQFHKGGQPNGSFLQITGDSDFDLPIPEADFTFQDLLMAQAMGDGEALTSRNLPLVRIHLKNRSAGIEELLTAVSKI